MPNYSKQREAILAVVRSLNTHPTAHEIYEIVRKTIPNISLGTVYRNLSMLSEGGKIDMLLLGDGSIRFDGNVKTHIHLTCTKCGKIEDVVLQNGDLEILKSAEKAGFVFERGVYVLYGTCADCKSK